MKNISFFISNKQDALMSYLPNDANWESMIFLNSSSGKGEQFITSVFICHCPHEFDQYELNLLHLYQ